MKRSLMVIGVLFSVTLVGLPSLAGENDQKALALCNCEANPEICARMREASAFERDPDHRGNAQGHDLQQRAPAGFSPQQFQGQRNTR